MVKLNSNYLNPNFRSGKALYDKSTAAVVEIIDLKKNTNLYINLYIAKGKPPKFISALYNI